MMKTSLGSIMTRMPAVIVLVTALVACGDAGSQPETSPPSPATATSGPVASATTVDAFPTTAAPDVGGSALLASIDPCALLREEDFGVFVDAGTAGVEDDLGGQAVRQCTWEGTLQDDFYTGLFLQVHAQPDIDAITFDAEPAFVVEQIAGEALPGAAVVSAPDPEVEVEESVVFIVFDAGDVLVAILPWASVFPGTPEFDSLVDLTLTAASRAAG